MAQHSQQGARRTSVGLQTPVSERRLRQSPPAPYPGEAAPSLLDTPPSAGVQLADDAVLERVVGALRGLARTASVELAFQVGELVVMSLYGGNIAALRERGRKEASFRRLAAHPDLPFSAATLWRSVAVYELLCKMPGLRHAKKLGLSHLHAVLSLPSPVQERLLVEAERESWTAERLARAADAARRKEASKGGRPRTPAAVRSLQEFQRRFEEAAEEHADLGFLRNLTGVERGELRAVAVRMRDWCEQVVEEVERRSGSA
jgi:hypothetical protein